MAGEPLVSETTGAVESHSSDALFFVFIALTLGVFTRHALRWTRVPWSVLLLIWGVLLGIGNETYTKSWQYIHPGIDSWEAADPNFLLALLLPVLIFGSAFTLQWHTLLRCWGQVLLLAGPGVVIGTALTGVVLFYVFPYGWSWTECLLLGSILSATDPVAVVALLKEVGASAELRTVVEGESLVNDGTAYVLFLLFQRLAEGQHETPGSVISLLCQLTLGGPAVGLAFGIAVIVWLRFIYSDDMVEITTTIIAAYGAFIVGNDILGVSGVLAVVTLGIFMAATGKDHISAKVEHPMHIVWEELEFIANTLIFVLAGAIIAGRIYADHVTANRASAVHAVDWAWAIALWLFLLVIRGVIFLLMYPILRRTGYGITWRTALVMVWSGVRGAVGLVLALFLLLDQKISDREFRVLSFFFVGCMAAITILVQGTTTGLLLQVLGLTKRLSVKRTFLRHVLQQVETHGAHHMEAVKAQGGLLGPPDWRNIADLTSLEGESLLKKYASFRMDSMRSMRHSSRQILDEAAEVERAAARLARQLNRTQLLRETRGRLLRAVQKTYKDVFDRNHIQSRHIYALKQATDKALDRVGEPLSDWKHLEASCKVPLYVHWLQWFAWTPFAGRWVRSKLFAAMETNTSMVVAFHYAHEDARESMKAFDTQLEDSLDPEWHDHILLSNEQEEMLEGMKRNVIAQVVMESVEECRAAEAYLLATRQAFPEVLASIRSRQVAQEVLMVKEDYLHDLGRSGLTDDREQAELEGLVERQLKRIHFAPPSTAVRSLRDSLPHHPLFAGIPLDVLRKEVYPFLHVRIYQRGEPLNDPTTPSDQVVVVMRGGLTITTPAGCIAACPNAAGAILGRQGLLFRLLPRAHSLGLDLTATTAVETFLLSQTAMEAIMRRRKVQTRALQLYGAVLAALYGDAALQDLSFQQLIGMFRESQLQMAAVGASIHVVGPAFLLEGKLASEHQQACQDTAADASAASTQAASCADTAPASAIGGPAPTSQTEASPEAVPAALASTDVHVRFAAEPVPSNGLGGRKLEGPCSLPAGPGTFTAVTPSLVLHLPAFPVPPMEQSDLAAGSDHLPKFGSVPDKHHWLPATRFGIPGITRAEADPLARYIKSSSSSQ
ncbi:hypothetical protein WJX72_000644 [[Myrmecia] bisecta]|uniref:Cation/H+ exchanger transmembrane domain-containing protein n=1 Tax=[Myrmecia] bisecta TaxID=41462 RepID=A0AAW1Q0Y6_9CHLO